MKRVTVNRVLKWKPCDPYREHRGARLKQLFPPRVGLSPYEVCDLDVPVNDRMWALLREDFLSARVLRLMACQWVDDELERARSEGHAPDVRTVEAVSVARRFAHGDATDAELAKALDDAQEVVNEEDWAPESLVLVATNVARAAFCVAKADAGEAAYGAATHLSWPGSDETMGTMLADVRLALVAAP